MVEAGRRALHPFQVRRLEQGDHEITRRRALEQIAVGPGGVRPRLVRRNRLPRKRHIARVVDKQWLKGRAQ